MRRSIKTQCCYGAAQFKKKNLKPRGKAWYEKELKKAFRRDNV